MSGQISQTFSAPWDVVLTLLEAFPAREVASLFRDLQESGRRLSGVVVCGWDEHGVLTQYLNENGLFVRVEDEEQPQSPKIYLTLQGATRTLNTIRKRQGRWEGGFGAPAHIGLWFWTHPQASDRPIDALVKLRHGFPGSPRQ